MKYVRMLPIPRALAPMALAMLCMLTLSACLQNEIIDDLSTEITITEPGQAGASYDVRKRFRFSRNPSDASGITLDGALMTVLSPVDADLSYIQRLTVLVETPDGEEIEVAMGEGFITGERLAELEVLYDGDLRGFVRDDSRIVLIFRVEPSAWVRPFPEDGLTVLARASVAIEL